MGNMGVDYVDPFEKQNRFYGQMKQDYLNGNIKNPVYEPYFNWKFKKGSLFSKVEAYAMMDAASDELDELYRKHPDAFSAIPQCDNNDVWCHYRLFKEDAYMVSYLEHLDAEVSELIVSGIL